MRGDEEKKDYAYTRVIRGRERVRKRKKEGIIGRIG